jgi:hypothetical protein
MRSIDMANARARLTKCTIENDHLTHEAAPECHFWLSTGELRDRLAITQFSLANPSQIPSWRLPCLF